MGKATRWLIPLTSLVLMLPACASEVSGRSGSVEADVAPVAPAPGASGGELPVAAAPSEPPSTAVNSPEAVPAEPSLEESPSIARVLAIDDAASAPDGVAVTSRARRLTQREYTRTVGALLGIDAGDAAQEFPEELPTLDGYFALGALDVGDRLTAELRTSAESLAARAVADAAAYTSLVGCTPAEAGCRDQFITAFGRRAYRRPLSEAEQARFQSLFDSGAEFAVDGDTFRAGVQLVVEAALQSPNFLYRVERGSGTVEPEGERISGYDAASRLSFLIWGQGPDAELLDAAESGALSTSDGISAHAERLALDPRARERVLDFHSRWLALDALPGASKDAAAFPDYSPELVTSMHAEVERFVEDIALNGDGALISLFTAPYGFADARLAALYGLPGTFGAELTRVDYGPDSPRAGLLTQAGFLSNHSSSNNGTSPILRGVFVLRRLLCQAIPDPPPNAQSTQPPPSPVPLVTTRDYYAWKTSMDACQGCHTFINPVGFAFEDFDGIGRHRTTEADAPIDASGVLQLSGEALVFEGGKQLATALAASPEAQACYARNWLRYAWGRADTESDLRTLTQLRLGLADPAYGVRDVLLEIARSTAFSHLASAD
jgi:hypothetical protein